MRAWNLLYGGLILALTLSACTSSTGDFQAGMGGNQGAQPRVEPAPVLPPDSASSAETDLSPGNTTVSGPEFVESLVDAYVAAEPELGSGVQVVTADGQIDLAADAGTEYGRQITCLVAQQSWFAVNRIAIPETVKEAAAWLRLDDPSDNSDVAVWLAGRAAGDPQKVAENLRLLQSWGAVVGAGPDSEAGDEDPRVVVASALLPWQQANNLHTGSEWLTIPSTCVELPLLATTNSAGAEQFLEYLLSNAGQETLAELGAAYPLSDSAIPEQVALLAPAPTDPKRIAPEDLAEWLLAATRGAEEGDPAQSD